VPPPPRRPRPGRFPARLGPTHPLPPSDAAQRGRPPEARPRHRLGPGAPPRDRVARFLDKAGITENTVHLRGTGKRAQEIEAKTAEAAAEAAKNAPPPASAAESAAPAPEATADAPPTEAPPAETDAGAAAEGAQPAGA
jgi:small subunit ribosomal protein S16